MTNSTDIVSRLINATMSFDWADLPDTASIPAVPLLREAADLIQSQQALIEEMVEALETYMFAVEQMNAAMKDGVNVQGAVSTLIGAEDMAKFILSKALSQKE